MIIIDKVETSGWKVSIRGMRNPMNSWDRSDSDFSNPNDPKIGENDLGLMRKLVEGGPVHSKFLRMISITMDITAPLYWWKEFDTYKVGTVANSCSTMHKIHAKEFTPNDFSHDHLITASIGILDELIDELNFFRKKFLETKDKLWWWQMIQLLPSSYNQKRTVMLNYEVARNIYANRHDHKLDEWHILCQELKQLPYSELITKGVETR